MHYTLWPHAADTLRHVQEKVGDPVTLLLEIIVSIYGLMDPQRRSVAPCVLGRDNNIITQFDRHYTIHTNSEGLQRSYQLDHYWISDLLYHKLGFLIPLLIETKYSTEKQSDPTKSISKFPPRTTLNEPLLFFLYLGASPNCLSKLI